MVQQLLACRDRQQRPRLQLHPKQYRLSSNVLISTTGLATRQMVHALSTIDTARVELAVSHGCPADCITAYLGTYLH